MKNQNNNIYAFHIPKPDGEFGSFTIRHMTPREYIELYEHVNNCKPVYFLDTAFEIRDYSPTSITVKDKNSFTDIVISLMFFRPYMTLPELENYYHYIKDYNACNENKGRFQIGDITVPLHCLSIKPFNSKAGNLLYGKKGT